MRKDMLKEYEGKKILITGGLGFIGSNLAIKLIELRPEKIVVVDSLEEECGGNEYNIREIRGEVDVSNIDVRDEKAIDTLIRGFKPDFIYSLAGLLSHTASLKDPKKDAEINAWAQYNLLESCRRNGHNVKILYAGTRGQYGKTPKIIPLTEEGSTLRPADPNGISKNSGEQACLFYGDTFPNIKAVSLRMTNTYGPRHQMRNKEQGFLNWFVRLAMDCRDIEIFEPGTQLRDFNYVDDVARALLMAMASEKTNGEVYNLGSCFRDVENRDGEDRSVGEIKELCENVISVKNVAEKIVEICKGVMGKSGNLTTVPYPEEVKKIEVGDIKMDFTKFYKDTGWMPLVNLDEGLKETIEFYKENKEHYF